MDESGWPPPSRSTKSLAWPIKWTVTRIRHHSSAARSARASKLSLISMMSSAAKGLVKGRPRQSIRQNRSSGTPLLRILRQTRNGQLNRVRSGPYGLLERPDPVDDQRVTGHHLAGGEEQVADALALDLDSA